MSLLITPASMAVKSYYMRRCCCSWKHLWRNSLQIAKCRGDDGKRVTDVRVVIMERAVDALQTRCIHISLHYHRTTHCFRLSSPSYRLRSWKALQGILGYWSSWRVYLAHNWDANPAHQLEDVMHPKRMIQHLSAYLKASGNRSVCERWKWYLTVNKVASLVRDGNDASR